MTPLADTLTTERLVLRKPQGSDLGAYTRYCTSQRSRFVRGPFTEAEAFDKLAAMIGHWAIRGFGRYVIEREGTPIGHAGPHAIETPDQPELTWTLWDGEEEGHGFATEAARATGRHCLEEHGWKKLTILVQPENYGSIAVARRLGATETTRPAPDWYPGCITFELTREVLQ